jgi:hypothetical protein
MVKYQNLQSRPCKLSVRIGLFRLQKGLFRQEIDQYVQYLDPLRVSSFRKVHVDDHREFRIKNCGNNKF